MASPAITNIVPLSVEFTPKGVLLRLDVTYKGGTKAVVAIKANNITEIARLLQPVRDIITKRGFKIGA